MALRSACVCVLFALFLVASGNAAQVEQRPVSKVLTLLKDMVKQLQKEAEEDEKLKEQMDCWCETGLKEKTTAIDDAQTKIGQLGAEISSTFAESSKLNTEIDNLNGEINKNNEALDKSTTLRGKQVKDFNSDETDMIGSIGEMKGAIETIRGTHEGSFERASQHARTGVHGLFLQKSPKSKDLQEAMVSVEAEMNKHPKLITAYQREVVAGFSQSPPKTGIKSSLLQQAANHNPAHSSSSGEIFGVLQGMKESFENDLGRTQADESRNQAAYESLKKAKNNELSAAQDLVDTKSTTLGNTDQRHAEAKQELKDTKSTLAADTDYLRNLKEQCKNVDAEYAERTKTRLDEITAVSKALAYLNSDDAQDLYARTFNSASSFLQKGTFAARTRQRGASILAAAGARSYDTRLTALASSILTAAPAANQEAAFEASKEKTFGKIKDEVRDMIDKLTTEKEDAVKHKDFCIEEINTNERNTDQQNNVKATHKAKIGELTAVISQLANELANLKMQIADLQVMLKRAGEDREKANAEFQSTVTDQRATRALLEGARGILQSFYNKKDALMQTDDEEPAGAPPPAGFKKYEKQASGGVMGMITQIVEDAKVMEADALKAEEEGQVAFETLVKETNESIIALQKAVAHKVADKAAAEADRAQTKIEHENTVQELDELLTANADLHKSCDYELKTFDSKQSARDDEIMALKEAIPIFSGATALLQKR